MAIKKLFKPAPRHEKLLQLLQDNKRPLSPKQAAELIPTSYSVASKDLNILAKAGCVKRSPGPGHSYFYSFAKWPATYDPSVGKESTSRVADDRPVSARSIIMLYESSCESGWQNKVVKEAVWYKHFLDRIFYLKEHAFNGSTIKAADLNELKEGLESFRKALLIGLEITEGLLNTSNIWDPKKFAAYLRSGEINDNGS